MVCMSTDQNFSRPGAVDLAGLTAAAANNTGQPTGAGARGSYVLPVTEADFEQVAAQSVRYPVVLVLTSTQAPGADQVVDDLTDAVNAQEGRLILGVVDVQSDPRIAQALQVQAVPTAIALIAGQMAPLFQGTVDKQRIVDLIAQVVQLAVANGLSGRATPVSTASVPEAAGEQADPRFAAADEALEAGDFQRAVEEFDKVLKNAPRDAQALAGRAQAALLARTSEVDPGVVAKADAAPTDIELGFAAADFELVTGDVARAFDRLLGLVRVTRDVERDKVRERLVELFETRGAADPEVKRARRLLSAALF
ncbi:hypothetical protein HMPREF1531_02011 [Propionibacterium sp. oral taxon 192 str. F0372]|nr:hypothetical protein HMPREF1531_02011 [Propionibacterium sp. oral taxon 192 str. F0372]